MDRIGIRRVGPEDNGLLARVAPNVFDDAIVPERLAACLAEPGHLMVIALDGDLVVGMATAMLHRHADKPTELYIDEIGSDDAYLRRGIGKQMMVEIIAWGRELGCEECWVGTEPDNAAARALYARWQPDSQPAVFYQFDI